MEPGDGELTMAQGPAHASRTALLVIDMVNDFLSGPFAGPGAERLIAPVRAAVDRARARGVPVVFVCDAHAADDDEFKVLPPHAVAGTPGAQLVPELMPRDGDAIVEKQRYSGFFKTRLEDVLRDLGVDTLAYCGLQTDCCVMHTVADGFFRGFRPVILEDAVTARTEDGHRRAMASMQRLYGAQAVTSDTFFALEAAE
jgi:nicotinamidase-related amidase